MDVRLVDAAGRWAWVDYRAGEWAGHQFSATSGKTRVESVRETPKGTVITLHLPIGGFPCAVRLGQWQCVFDGVGGKVNGGDVLKLTVVD